MTRTPGLPGVARASRIRFSSAGAIGGRPRRLPSPLARASPAWTRSAIMAARTRQRHPSSDCVRTCHDGLDERVVMSLGRGSRGREAGSISGARYLEPRLTPRPAARTAPAIISPALRAKLSSSYIGAGSLADASVGVSFAVPLGRSSENSLPFAFLTPRPLAALMRHHGRPNLDTSIRVPSP